MGRRSAYITFTMQEFTTLRVYALSGGNKMITSIVLLLSTGPFLVNVVCHLDFVSVNASCSLIRGTTYCRLHYIRISQSIFPCRTAVRLKLLQVQQPI